MEPERIETYRLLAGLPGHRRRVERALEFVGAMLSQCRNPYVAWSGGKDSTVLLHLCMRVRPSIPAVCCQTDIDLPDNIEFVPRAAAEMGINLTVIRPRVSAWEVLVETGGPFGQVNVATSRLDRECFFEPIMALVRERGYDLVFLGLRGEESRARLLNRRVRGLSYRNQTHDITTATPIADWSGRDVMAYLVGNDIPINPVYSKTKFHPEPERVREGWWVPGEKGAAHGGVLWLRYYYPELYQRLAREWPEVASFG